MGRLELPTLGLEKRYRPVPHVWLSLISITSVGIRASDSGEIVLFGHEYAPQYAPHGPPSFPVAAVYLAVQRWTAVGKTMFDSLTSRRKRV